jgi:hypoxia up-regulated 1
MVESNRSTLTFVAGDDAGNTYSLEELIAMQFVNIKTQGEKMANEKIKELVLTVPAFWTEQERKAIIDAADLAGMKVSTLIHDGLAGTPPPPKSALLTFSCDRLF